MKAIYTNQMNGITVGSDTSPKTRGGECLSLWHHISSAILKKSNKIISVEQSEPHHGWSVTSHYVSSFLLSGCTCYLGLDI